MTSQLKRAHECLLFSVVIDTCICSMIVISVDRMPTELQRRAVRQLPTFRAMAKHVLFNVPLVSIDGVPVVINRYGMQPAYRYYDNADHVKIRRLLQDTAVDVVDTDDIYWVTTFAKSHDIPAWDHLICLDEMLRPLLARTRWTLVLTSTRLFPICPETFIGMRAASGLRMPRLPDDTNIAGVLQTAMDAVAGGRRENATTGAISLPAPVTTCLHIDSLLDAQRLDVSPLDAKALWFRVLVPRCDRCSRIVVVLRFGLEELASLPEWERLSDADRCRRMAETSEWTTPRDNFIIEMYDASDDTGDNLYADATFCASEAASRALADALGVIQPTVTLRVPPDLWLRAPSSSQLPSEDTPNCCSLSTWLPLSVRSRLPDAPLPPCCTVWVPEFRSAPTLVVPLTRSLPPEWVQTGDCAFYTCTNHSVHAMVIARREGQNATQNPHNGVSGAVRGRAREHHRRR